jgi:pterin-4a-carbinolamine dehydratase
MNQDWQQRDRPVRLERRYEFEDYSTLNITIHMEEGAESLDDKQHRFAEELDQLAKETNH